MDFNLENFVVVHEVEVVTNNFFVHIKIEKQH